MQFSSLFSKCFLTVQKVFLNVYDVMALSKCISFHGNLIFFHVNKPPYYNCFLKIAIAVMKECDSLPLDWKPIASKDKNCFEWSKTDSTS